MTMIGFPPALADRWSLDELAERPAQPLVVPAPAGGRADRPGRPRITPAPRPLALGSGFDAEQVVWRLDGRSGSVAEVLADTFTDGFLVLHDGRMVTEQYPTGMPPDRTHLLMSVSKSVIGCVVGILADSGAIDVTAAVDYYVPELAHSGYRGATVQDVLDMRSGITFSEEYLNPDAEVRLLEQVIGWAPQDPARACPPRCTNTWPRCRPAARTAPPSSTAPARPTSWAGSAERASGIRMPELLSSLIWSRIGAEQDMDAAVDPAGAVFHDGGLAATLRDLGRFGQMLLDGGAIAAGEQVVPAVVDRRQPRRRRRYPGEVRGVGQRVLAARRRLPQPVLAARNGREVLLCLGIHGQMIWVEPARRLVVVKLSSWPLPQDVSKLLDTFAAIDMIGFQLTLG